jgi:DNA polymerase-3 subunit gamma/tau
MNSPPWERFLIGEILVCCGHMSHTTLYRKYRPAKFSEVLGQDHIIETLKNELKEGKIAHAYLFFGPRGTGKTSIARIFAAELGCSPEDLYEIDGASNRGIDEIRVLKEGVGTLPFRGDIKVYVIDEVHMLTKEAFNALLKTLEEPPEYVVFILATTELHKVPDTIISRCQSFTFKKPTEHILKKMVETVSKKEGATLDEEAVSLISFLGDGSFRDTHTVLEQVLNISGKKKIEGDDVAKITGTPTKLLIHSFIEALLEKDSEKGLSAIKEASEKNMDMKIYAKLILKHLRYALLLSFSQNLADSIKEDVGEDEFKYLEKISQHENKKIFPEAIEILIDVHAQISRAYIEELPLELALVKLSRKEG